MEKIQILFYDNIFFSVFRGRPNRTLHAHTRCIIIFYVHNRFKNTQNRYTTQNRKLRKMKLTVLFRRRRVFAGHAKFRTSARASDDIHKSTTTAHSLTQTHVRGKKKKRILHRFVRERSPVAGDLPCDRTNAYSHCRRPATSVGQRRARVRRWRAHGGGSKLSPRTSPSMDAPAREPRFEPNLCYQPVFSASKQLWRSSSLSFSHSRFFQYSFDVLYSVKTDLFLLIY